MYDCDQPLTGRNVTGMGGYGHRSTHIEVWTETVKDEEWKYKGSQ
jgi:hypothetical protein